jgi:hypothetical protein
MFYHFWDFDRLVEGRVQGEAEIVGSWPLFKAVFLIHKDLLMTMVEFLITCVN